MKRTTYIFIGLLVSGLIVIVATIIFIFMSGKPYQEDGAFLGNEQVKMDLNGVPSGPWPGAISLIRCSTGHGNITSTASGLT